MSSTDLTLDEQDIHFLLKDWLNVSRLSQYDSFKDFDQETIEMLVEEGLRFATDVVAPSRTESDRQGCRMEDGRVVTPECMKEPYRKGYELGWAALNASPEYGGQGAPASVGLAVNEGINAGNPGLSAHFALTIGAARLVESFGSEELKAKYIERMNRGEFNGTMCLSEPHAGSDVGAGLTTAEDAGDGTYRIKGTKSWISNGDTDLAENSIHAVLARIKGAPEGTGGLSLFLIPHTLVEEDGKLGAWNDVTVASIENKMGLHSSPTAVLKFGENDHCRGWLLGEENRGMSCMFQMMNEARIGTALIGLANGSAAYQNALSYARERVQGTHISKIREPGAPKVAIIEHPAVRYNLMQMKGKVEGMRALLYATANILDDLECLDQEDPLYEDSRMLLDILTPLCKGWCTETGIDVVRTAIQVLGGVGYTKDFPLEQMYRDIRVSAIYEGTTDIQALDLVGRKMTLQNGALFQSLMGRFSSNLEKNRENPQLQAAYQQWEKQCETLYEMAMGSKEVVEDRGIEGVALYATPFLKFLATVAAAGFLLEQAVIAVSKLDQLIAEKAVKDSDLEAFLENNPEARFFNNKRITAQNFVDTIVPEAEALLAGAKSRNYGALDINF